MNKAYSFWKSFLKSIALLANPAMEMQALHLPSKASQQSVIWLILLFNFFSSKLIMNKAYSFWKSFLKSIALLANPAKEM